MNKSISVIISAFNAEGTISSCLKSLANQTESFEIVVVDDGSTDRTVQLIKAFKHVSLIQTGHHGPGTARNRGAREAHGQILVFVDADMIFDPTFIEKLVAPIKSGESKGTWTREEKVANWSSPFAQAWNLEYTHNRSPFRVPPNAPDLSPVFRAILKSEFDRVGGFDATGYTDDWTLSQKLGYKATNAPGAIMFHKNPDTPQSLFIQATWIAKRQYKWGEVGRLLALLRASLPISFIYGLSRSVYYNLPIYLPFKLLYDLGICYGIVSFWVWGKHEK